MLVKKDAFCCDTQWQISENFKFLAKVTLKLLEMIVRQVYNTNNASRDCLTPIRVKLLFKKVKKGKKAITFPEISKNDRDFF